MNAPEKRRKPASLFFEWARLNAIAVLSDAADTVFRVTDGNLTELEKLRALRGLSPRLREAQIELIKVNSILPVELSLEEIRQVQQYAYRLVAQRHKNENPPCSGGHS